MGSEVDEGPSREGGPLRVAALGGISFPRPFVLEGLVGVERTFAMGAEYSFLPQSTIGGVDMTFWALTADARLFPFGGPFFIGLRGGHQHLSGSLTSSLGPIGTVTGTMSVDTWIVNPRVGLLWMWNSWLAVGVEAGVQIPLSSDTSTSLPANLPSDPRVTNVVDRLSRVTDALGASTLPTLDLLRLGLVL
jgi:hypothetical protein